MRVVDCAVERVDAPGWGDRVDEVGAGGAFGVGFFADEAGSVLEWEGLIGLSKGGVRVGGVFLGDGGFDEGFDVYGGVLASLGAIGVNDREDEAGG